MNRKNKHATTRAIEMVIQRPMLDCIILLDQLADYQQTETTVAHTIVETDLRDAFHARFRIEQRVEVDKQVVSFIDLRGTLTEDENYETTTVIAEFLVPNVVDNNEEKWAILLALVFIAVMSLTIPMHIFYKLGVIAVTLVIAGAWWAYYYRSARDLRPYLLIQQIERALKHEKTAS